jgi:thiol-disulfide isomerase/thioredoxin
MKAQSFGDNGFQAGRPSSIVAGVVALACSLVSLGAQGADQHLSEVDKEVPLFSNLALDGSEWDAKRLQGKPWIVNFWATWCGPCIEEMPAMNRAWQQIEQDGIGMLAINAGENRESIVSFLAKVPVDFEIVLGDAMALPDWGVRVLPTTYVIDAEGRIVYEALGPREWDDPELLDRVRALVPSN